MDPKYNNYRIPEPNMEAAYQAERTSDYVPTPAPVRMHSDIAGGEVEVLKVSGKSRPSSVAGAIAGVVRNANRVEIQAIGAGATNQAIKAVAIARGYLISSGIDIVCIPAFIDVTIDNEERTAIKLLVERRPGYGLQ
jgi:stage V sporulation protein S